MHYLICLVLWQIANEIIGHESSVHIGSRLCFCFSSETKLKRLAIAHTVYHFCKFDTNVQLLVSNIVNVPTKKPSEIIFEASFRCMKPLLAQLPWHIIQDTATGYARTVKYMVQ